MRKSLFVSGIGCLSFLLIVGKAEVALAAGGPLIEHVRAADERFTDVKPGGLWPDPMCQFG